jgi:GNAT superfamily N-acetyltransferase
MSYFERNKGTYKISTDPRCIDLEAIHASLSRSYWAEEIPKEILAKAIASSLCFALLDGSHQIGFARVVTDRATFAYLCDVYVHEEYRGRGLGKWLIAELLSHPDLQGLRRFLLITRDAHRLYSQFGFGPLENSKGYMEIVHPDIYKRT